MESAGEAAMVPASKRKKGPSAVPRWTASTMAAAIVGACNCISASRVLAVKANMPLFHR